MPAGRNKMPSREGIQRLGGLVSDPEQDYRPNLQFVFMSAGFATQEECLSLMIYLQ